MGKEIDVVFKEKKNSFWWKFFQMKNMMKLKAVSFSKGR